MIRNLAGLLPLFATAAALSPAAAAAQNADRSDPIVIEGKRIDRNAAREQARDITPDAGSTSEALPRFQRPICAGVWGLMAGNAEQVIERIYENAEYLGIDVDRSEGCKANVWLIIVDDPMATFEQLREEKSALVRDLPKYQRQRVERQSGPARVWSLTTDRDDNGNPVPTGHEMAAAFALSKALDNPPPAITTTRMSRLHVPVRTDIDLSMVLIARSAIGALDAHSLADYASMRAFTRTDEPQDAGSFGTILTLFNQQDGPTRLTAFDRGYLRSLYATSEHRPARIGLGGLRRKIEEEIAKEQ